MDVAPPPQPQNLWVCLLKNVCFPGKAELRVKKEDTLNAMRLVRACQKSIAAKGPVTMET